MIGYKPWGLQRVGTWEMSVQLSINKGPLISIQPYGESRKNRGLCQHPCPSNTVQRPGFFPLATIPNRSLHHYSFAIQELSGLYD
jgi:hypothetical protein